MKKTLSILAIASLTTLSIHPAFAQGSGSPGGSGMSDPGAGPGNTAPMGGPGDPSNPHAKTPLEQEASRNVNSSNMPKHAYSPDDTTAGSTTKSKPAPSKIPQSSPGG